MNYRCPSGGGILLSLCDEGPPVEETSSRVIVLLLGAMRPQEETPFTEIVRIVVPTNSAIPYSVYLVKRVFFLRKLNKRSSGVAVAICACLVSDSVL